MYLNKVVPISQKIIPMSTTNLVIPSLYLAALIHVVPSSMSCLQCNSFSLKKWWGDGEGGENSSEHTGGGALRGRGGKTCRHTSSYKRIFYKGVFFLRPLLLLVVFYTEFYKTYVFLPCPGCLYMWSILHKTCLLPWILYADVCPRCCTNKKNNHADLVSLSLTHNVSLDNGLGGGGDSTHGTWKGGGENTNKIKIRHNTGSQNEQNNLGKPMYAINKLIAMCGLGRGKHEWKCFSHLYVYTHRMWETAECLHRSSFLPRYFLHACFLRMSFFTECIFFLQPLHLLAVFYTWVFLHNVRFFSLTLGDFFCMWFFTNVFFTERFSSFGPSTYWQVFLHLSFFTQRTFFLPCPGCFSQVNFYKWVFIERNISSGSSIYWQFLHLSFYTMSVILSTNNT